MSDWTYVDGMIRGDMVGTKENEKKLKDVLGHQLISPQIKCVTGKGTFDKINGKWVPYDSPERKTFDDEWRRAFDRNQFHLPMGSEGSIVWSVSKTHGLFLGDTAHYMVSFTGSLRDFGGADDENFIKKWFQGIIWAYGIESIAEMNYLCDNDFERWLNMRTTPLSVEYAIMRISCAGCSPKILICEDNGHIKTLALTEDF